MNEKTENHRSNQSCKFHINPNAVSTNISSTSNCSVTLNRSKSIKSQLPANNSYISPFINNPPPIKDSLWLTLPICNKYQQNECKLDQKECLYAHPPPNVEIQDGRVVCCFDSIKAKCSRKNPPCKYFHPPNHLKEVLIRNGKHNLFIRTLRNFNRSILPTSIGSIPFNLSRFVAPNNYPHFSHLTLDFFSNQSKLATPFAMQPASFQIASSIPPNQNFPYPSGLNELTTLRNNNANSNLLTTGIPLVIARNDAVQNLSVNPPVVSIDSAINLPFTTSEGVATEKHTIAEDKIRDPAHIFLPIKPNSSGISPRKRVFPYDQIPESRENQAVQFSQNHIENIPQSPLNMNAICIPNNISNMEISNTSTVNPNFLYTPTTLPILIPAANFHISQAQAGNLINQQEFLPAKRSVIGNSQVFYPQISQLDFSNAQSTLVGIEPPNIPAAISTESQNPLYFYQGTPYQNGIPSVISNSAAAAGTPFLYNPQAH